MIVSRAAGRAAFCSLVVVVFVGCRKQGQPKVPEDAVAMVGDRPITRAQLERHIDRLPPVLRQQYTSAESRKPLLDALVRQELLLQEARRQGLENDPEYREVVDQQLIALLMRRSLEGKDGAQATTEADVEAYYRKHLDQFSAPAQVRISQIVAPDKALAARVLKQVRGLRKDDAAGFAALAAKHSIDAPSREKGGDVGFISRDTGLISPTVRANAFLLANAGDIADLVETDHGFHVIRLTDRRAAAARPLAEVKDEIRQRLMNEQRSKRTEALIAAGKSKSKVEVFGDRLAGVAQPSLAATSTKKDGK